MAITVDSGRLGWLGAALAAQTGKLMSLLGRLGDLNSLRALNPRLFSKFVNMLGQVAVAKAEEAEIISEIEAIERKHRLQRQCGSLKHFENDDLKPDLQTAENAECDRPDKSWKAFLARLMPDADWQAGETCGLEQSGLVQLEPGIEADVGAQNISAAAPAPSSGSGAAWKLFALWYLLSLGSNSASKQDLTAD